MTQKKRTNEMTELIFCCGCPDDDGIAPHQVSSFRRILPQVGQMF